MGNGSLAKRGLIRVICEACIREPNAHCPICAGSKYYYWDPDSLRCYGSDGEPMLAENADGELVNVVRQPRGKTTPDLETALAFIEIWVLEDPTRKWKLWIEDGWNCCVWANQYSQKGKVFTARDAATCVNECYEHILSLIAGSDT